MRVGITLCSDDSIIIRIIITSYNNNLCNSMYNYFVFSFSCHTRSFENYDITYFETIKWKVMLNNYEIANVKNRYHTFTSNHIKRIIDTKCKSKAKPKNCNSNDNNNYDILYFIWNFRLLLSI